MQRLDPFDKRAMALSIVLHGLMFTLGLVSTVRQEPTIEFISYEIDLVSPPPAVQADEYTPASEELVVERPEPERAPPEPEPEPEPEPDPEPEITVAAREPEPSPAAPTRQPEPEPPAASTPAAGPNPSPEPAARSGEGISVRMEGLRRDYPEYYNNIIRQIYRCLRGDRLGRWEAVVDFVIQRDGWVRDDIRFVTRSGNTSFDFEAMSAVECAGQGRFGPLPEAYESLTVRFDFSPSGGG